MKVLAAVAPAAHVDAADLFPDGDPDPSNEERLCRDACALRELLGARNVSPLS